MTDLPWRKPAKGEALLQRRAKRRMLDQAERIVMQAARQRDGNRCRVPECEHRTAKLPIDVAHERHRGMGGNPKGDRTILEGLIALCRSHHGDYDAGRLEIAPVSGKNLGFSGFCEFKAEGRVIGYSAPYVAIQVFRR